MAHFKHLQLCLRALYNIPSCCDVTLVCGRDMIPVHKVVLLAYSRLLGSQLLGVLSPDQVTMNLDNLDVECSMVQRVVFYMYHGYFESLEPDDIVELHRTANILQVREAALFIEKFVSSSYKCAGMQLIAYPQTQELGVESVVNETGKNIFRKILDCKVLSETKSVKVQTDSNRKNFEVKRKFYTVETQTNDDPISENDPLPLLRDIVVYDGLKNECKNSDNITDNIMPNDSQSMFDSEENEKKETHISDEDNDLVKDFIDKQSVEDDNEEEEYKAEDEKVTKQKTSMKLRNVNLRKRKLKVSSSKLRKARKTATSETRAIGKVKIKEEKDDRLSPTQVASTFEADTKDDIQESIETNECALSPKGIKKEKSGGRVFSGYKLSDGTYQCPDCDETLSGYKDFMAHLRNHRGEKMYHCDKCPKTFTCSKHLRSHLRTHSSERPYACDVCGATFKDPKHRNRHKKLHSGEKPVVCTHEGCDQRFVDRDRMRKHIDVAHLNYKPHKCDHPGCDYASSSKNAVQIHKIKHKPKEDRQKIICYICGKPLTGARSIQLHMLLHEGEEIKCTECDYSSVFKGAVKSHMLRQHGIDLDGKKVDKQYKCEICGYEAYFITEFKFHMAKHSGERPHKCPICNFDTNDKGSLKKHIRGHTGETPFPCETCGKAYSNSSALARHRRSHTGEKPHKCDKCDASYADKKSLVAHSYKHIGLKPFMCHMCSYTCVKKPSLTTHIVKTHGKANLPDNLTPRIENKKHRPRAFRALNADGQPDAYIYTDTIQAEDDNSMSQQETIIETVTLEQSEEVNRQNANTMITYDDQPEMHQFVDIDTQNGYGQHSQIQQQPVAIISDHLIAGNQQNNNLGINLSFF